MSNSNRLKNKKKLEDLILFKSLLPEKINSSNSAVFFDRDGVIIEDLHYINNPEDVKLCPNAKTLIRYFFNKKFLVVIITNQSGISKNILTWEDYKKVTNKLIKLLGEPNPIKAIYANSYLSIKPNTNWRKPNPNMILNAAKKLRIDLNKSILIGDRKTDIIAGARAGIPNLFHVKTGHGKEEKNLIENNLNKKNEIIEGVNKSKVFFINNLNNFPYDILDSTVV